MNITDMVLGLIAKQPSYGYDIKQEYDKLFGADKSLASGQVYSSLARLTRDQKVELVANEDSDEGPDRKRYQITEIGKSALEDWLITAETPSPNLQAELFTKVVLALILKKDAAKYLDVQRSAHINRMRQINHQRKSRDLSYMLLADHALYHIEADIRWIDLTASRLNSLKKELSI